MDVCQDFEDLFKVLNSYKIKYLVIGAHAVVYYSEPRYTKDLDVWILPTLNDVHKIYRAFKEFGAPLDKLKPQDFADKKLIQSKIKAGRPHDKLDLLILEERKKRRSRKR